MDCLDGLKQGSVPLKKIVALSAAAGVLLSGCVTLGLSTESAVIRAKNKVAPALVHIRPVKEVFTGGRRTEVLVVGSGFIISRDGYVVTNEHVAGESAFVRCVLENKEEVEAAVVGVDPYTDIAVLKLAEDHGPYPYAKLGTSRDLEAGQTVIAMGSPHGLARSVSLGIVSVTDRYLPEGGPLPAPYHTWIQTDAAINRGNSGGPLVNLRGEVVGVNARKQARAENIGFAIPIDAVVEVVDAIIAHGRVQRSWLGLTLQEITVKTDDVTQKGAVIADVDPLSPAYEAGLRAGDVLLTVNGQSTDARFVEDLPAVRKRIADLAVGEPATLRIARGGAELDIEVVTAEKSELRGKEVEFREWGFTATEVTPAVARVVRLETPTGIFVSGVQVGGLAGNARLKRGEIILSVDGRAVGNLAAFQRLYGELVGGKQRLVLLQVKFGALTRFVLLKQEDVSSGAAVDSEEDVGED